MARYIQSERLHGRADVRASLRGLIEHLQSEGVIREEFPVHQMTLIDRCIESYKQYLRDQRGLAAGTIIYDVRIVRRFLQGRFGDRDMDLAQLNADDVIGFVRHESDRLSGRNGIKVVPPALRSFLRYVHTDQEGMPDLASQVPAVASWALTSVPRGISADQIQQLLSGVDRDTPKGRRDYAILLLLARLGLRASEVAFLEMDDIDWEVGALTVTVKGKRRKAYPLTQEIGEAIADYLQHGRPSGSPRCVFLRVNAPIRGFLGSSGISRVVRYWLKRAAVDAPTDGAHPFRHGLATTLLNAGASLWEIGDMLGHRNPDTTRIYTKVDIVALRSLALPWPGGVQ